MGGHNYDSSGCSTSNSIGGSSGDTSAYVG
jgi:hypothetical protein